MEVPLYVIRLAEAQNAFRMYQSWCKIWASQLGNPEAGDDTVQQAFADLVEIRHQLEQELIENMELLRRN